MDVNYFLQDYNSNDSSWLQKQYLFGPPESSTGDKEIVKSKFHRIREQKITSLLRNTSRRWKTNCNTSSTTGTVM